MTMIDGPRRAPASGGDAKQLVILVHGYGASGSDLIPLADALAGVLPEALFVAPDAPEELAEVPGGRQWFPIASLDPHELRAGVRAAAPALDAFIDAELEKAGLTDKDLALVGFSQGAMLVLQAGLRRKTAPAAIIGFSGALPDVDTLDGEITARPPVFLAHGEADQVIPYQATLAAAQSLARHGLGVAVHTAPDLGHSIGPEGLQIAGAVLRDAMAGTLELPVGAHNVMAAQQNGD